jgi:RNA polymerase primary sigma factor
MPRPARADSPEFNDNQYLSVVSDPAELERAATLLLENAPSAAGQSAIAAESDFDDGDLDESIVEDADPIIGIVRTKEQETDEDDPTPARRGSGKNPGYTSDLVRLYMNEAGRTPLLDAEQEVSLAKSIEAGIFAGAIIQLAEAKKAGTEAEEQAKFLLWMQDRTGSGIKDRDKRKQHATDFVDWVEAHADEAPVGSRQFRELRAVQGAGKAATDHLLNANLRLVISIAKRYTGRGMDFLDVIQFGNEGLVRGVQKFDYTKGYKFSTYATWWIRQSITRAMADHGNTIRIPVHRAEQHNRMWRISRELEKDGVDATPERLAAEMDVPVERVLEYMDDAQVSVSLDQAVGDASSGGRFKETYLGDLLPDPKAQMHLESVENELRDGAIAAVLKTLTSREAGVIRLRYGFDGQQPLTLTQVGEVYGVTRERIRQIEKQALEKLRDKRRSALLRDWVNND